VVLIDDEPHVLDSLRRALASESCEFLATDDPDDVLRWVEREDVRLVISDERMPRLAGSCLVGMVHRQAPDLPCMLLTAYPDSPSVAECAREEEALVLPKPWEDGYLRGKVRELLRLPGRRSSAGPAPAPPPGDDATPYWSAKDVLDRVVRMDCRGRSPREVLDRALSSAFAEDSPCQGLAIILDHLGALGEGTALLLEGFRTHTEAWGTPLTVIDSTGGLPRGASFMESLGGVTVCGPGVPGSLLIVTASEDAADLMSVLARSVGLDPRVAASGREARRILDARDFDRVVLDLAVHDLDAWAAPARGDRPGGSLRIIGLTDGPFLWDPAPRSWLGLREMLAKPFCVPDFLALLAGVPGARKP
jgi:DNA-binding NtrC family response regulator